MTPMTISPNYYLFKGTIQKGLLSRAVLFNLNFITMKNTFITSVIVASTTVQKYAKKQ